MSAQPAPKASAMSAVSGSDAEAKTKLFSQWRSECDAGKPEAQNHVALCYLLGSNVAKDPKQAAELFKKSAEAGYPEAQHNLGFLYDCGIGVSKSARQAFNWYLKAAENKNVIAEKYVCYCFEKAIGTVQDNSKAKHWGTLALTHTKPPSSSSSAPQTDGVAATAATVMDGTLRHVSLAAHLEIVENDRAGALTQWRLALYKADDPDGLAAWRVGNYYYNNGGLPPLSDDDSAEAQQKEEEQCTGKYRPSGEGLWSQADKKNHRGIQGRCHELGLNTSMVNKSSEYNRVNGVPRASGQRYKLDPKLAFELYVEHADATGDMDSIACVAACYEKGVGVKKNEAAAVEWYQKIADKGHAHAQYKLGLLLQSGLGIAKDEQRGFDYCRRAADQSHSEALIYLVRAYTTGTCGAKSDAKKAFDAAVKAAAIFNLHGRIAAAQFYEKGIGTDRSPEKAVHYYRKAAKQMQRLYLPDFKKELPDVLFHLGLLQREFPQSERKELFGGIITPGGLATDFFKASSGEDGHPEALYELGVERATGRCDGEVNRDLAFSHFDAAAQKGHPEGKCMMGLVMERTLRNPKQAVELYRAAIAGNSVPAQNYLGQCYEYGVGIAKDLVQAAQCYRLAAAGGNPVAHYNLGRFLQQGIGGVAKNEAQAQQHYAEAVKQLQAELQGMPCEGKCTLDSRAAFTLADCYRLGRGIPKDGSRAIFYYDCAVKLLPNDLEIKGWANYWMGWCYANGLAGANKSKEAAACHQEADKTGANAALNDRTDWRKLTPYSSTLSAAYTQMR